MLSFFATLLLFVLGGFICLLIVVFTLMNPVAGPIFVLLAFFLFGCWANGYLPRLKPAAKWLFRIRTVASAFLFYVLFINFQGVNRLFYLFFGAWCLFHFWKAYQKACPPRRKTFSGFIVAWLRWAPFLLMACGAAIGYGFYIYQSAVFFAVLAAIAAARAFGKKTWKGTFSRPAQVMLVLLGFSLFWRCRFIAPGDCKDAWSHNLWAFAYKKMGHHFEPAFDPIQNQLMVSISDKQKIIQFNMAKPEMEPFSYYIEQGKPQRIGVDPIRKKFIVPLMRTVPLTAKAESKGKGRINVYDWSGPDYPVEKGLPTCLTVVDIEISLEKNRFYTLCDTQEYMEAFNTETLERVARIPNGGSYQVIQPAGTNRLYTSAEGGLIKLFNADTLELEKQKTYGPLTLGIAYSKKRNRLYVARSFRSRVDILDGDSLERLGSVKVKFFPRDLTIDDEGDKLFVDSYAAGVMNIIDLSDNTNKAAVPLGKLARGLQWNESARRLFVCSACGVFEVDVERELKAAAAGR